MVCPEHHNSVVVMAEGFKLVKYSSYLPINKRDCARVPTYTSDGINECAHVSINEDACHRAREDTQWNGKGPVMDEPCHSILVLELPSCRWDSAVPCTHPPRLVIWNGKGAALIRLNVMAAAPVCLV